MSQIVFDNVRKMYGDVTALSDVSLEIEDNVTTAIVGPSGSGKSTLLQLINGLVRPDRGQIAVFGSTVDYSDLPTLRLKIGYAVQGTGLFPHLSVIDNITLLARLARWPSDRTRDRANELIRLVGLPRDVLTRYPYEISGGQQQRVGLCRAMMLDPAVFLLDEPFGALDPITRSEIHDEFLHLEEASERTIVLVTHDVREAVKLASRLVIIDQGYIVQYGKPEDVLANPTNEFVERLLMSQLETGRPRH